MADTWMYFLGGLVFKMTARTSMRFEFNDVAKFENITESYKRLPFEDEDPENNIWFAAKKLARRCWASRGEPFEIKCEVVNAVTVFMSVSQ